MKIIITHQNADFDGLAAMLGVRKLRPDHQIVLGRNVSTPVRNYLALHKDWLTVQHASDIDGSAVDEVVIVDARDRRRLRDFADALEGAQKITVIDHHPAGSHDVEATTEVVEPVGSSATIVCERIEERDIELSAEEATLLLLGIYADTGNVSFPSTTARDLQAAAFLRKNGASLPVVNRYLQQEFSPQQQQLLVALINEMDVIQRRGLRIGCAGYETPQRVRGAAMVVERALQLMGLDACFVALQERGKEPVQLIGRSLTRHVDAGAIARLWDGGGHASAAAARTREMSRPQVLDQLAEHLRQLDIDPLQIEDVMSSPVQVVPHDMTLETLEPKLDKWGVSGVPVERAGKLSGIVSRRDTDDAVERGDWSVPVAGFMTHEVTTASLDDALEEALEVMTREDIGRLPVIDEGAIVGIVSRSDILRRLYDDEAADTAVASK